MKKHPDKNEIIKAAAGLIDNSSIMKHITSCPVCMKYFQDLSRVLSASDNSKLSVSEDVEHRIINSYRNIKLNTNVSADKHTGLFKPAMAAFAVVIIAVASIFFYSSNYKDEEIKISFKSLQGNSYINGARLNDILISSGDKIITKSDSSSKLEIDRMFLINIYPDSEIEIEKSSFVKKEKINEFNFRLISGTIHAEFKKQSFLKYRFTTVFAVIESIGTEFTLKNTKDETTVEVSEGSLFITAIKTGETKIAVTGKKYTIKDNIELSDIDKASDKNEKFQQGILNSKTDLHKNEVRSSITEENPKSNTENKNSELKNNNSADKNEIRKMMKDTKKEMNREMKGNMRNEMKKERGGFGK